MALSYLRQLWKHVQVAVMLAEVMLVAVRCQMESAKERPHPNDLQM